MIIVSRVVSRGISTVRRRGQIEAKSHHRIYVHQRRGNKSTLSSSQDDEEPFYGKPRARESILTSTIGNRIAIAIHNATTAYSDPTRADAVAVLGEITGPITLQRIHQKMIKDPIGRQILKDRPIVSKATIPEYEQLILNAPNYDDTINNHDDDNLTFGQAYGSFLKIHGFDPDERDDVNYIEDDTLAYIMLRYRQCHDYFHTITGLPPTVLGELGLKWFELFQTGLPIAALSCTVGSLRLNHEEQQILQNIYLPWAMKMNSQQQDPSSSSSSLSSPFLMNIYYEKEFDTPIKELRNRLNLVPAPSIISSSNSNST